MNLVSRALSAILLSSVVTLPAMAGDVNKTIYVCDQNQKMEVVYINTDTGDSYAVIHPNDEMLPMELMKMASGANYKTMDKNYTYKLYTKGEAADLVEGDDKPVMSNCKAAN